MCVCVWKRGSTDSPQSLEQPLPTGWARPRSMAQSREEQLGGIKQSPQHLELRLFLVPSAALVRPGTSEEGL